MIPLLPDRARDQRDALAKSLYQHLFEWLIDRINYALVVKTGAKVVSEKNIVTVGVLDIYGFGAFLVCFSSPLSLAGSLVDCCPFHRLAVGA